MKKKIVAFVLSLELLCFLFFGTHGLSSDGKLPIIDGKKAVATVNEEPISLEDLNRAIAASHADRSRDEKAGQIDYSDIMQRLINTRLIVLEAKNMGLDELPEIKDALETYSRQTLMELLLEGYVKDIEADDEAVRQHYEPMVREWKIKAIRFKKEQDARQIHSQLEAGGDFDEILQKAVEWGVGEADRQANYIKNKDLTGGVAEIIAQMKIGSTSPIISIGKRGYIIFKLEDSRLPAAENQEAMAIARLQALNQKRVEAARDYYNALKKRNLKLDDALFDQLDFESKEPGFEKLLTDKRVLARFKGQKPLTVGEFTQTVKDEFYHGVSQAIKSKRINKKKSDILEDLLQKRLLVKAALDQGIDRTEAYRLKVKQHEISLIFDKFISKVVAPDIKLNLKDLQTYHAQNAEKFTSPVLLRIRSLAFGKRNDAVTAIDKLKKGTDFSWLGSNAEGQLDQNTEGILKFDGKLVTLSSLPEKVQKAVSGANSGEFRLYEGSEGPFYVLYVYELFPAKVEPFEAVKQEIAKKVFNDKLKKSVEHWADQLRAYYPVKIYRADLEK